MNERTVQAQDDFREMLKQSSELVNEIRWGVEGYLDRIAEMSGNFPGGGSGSVPLETDEDGEKASGPPVSDPTFNAVGKRDPGRAELAEFRKECRKLYQDVLVLHARWKRGRESRSAPAKLDDPGCELCNGLPPELPNGEPIETHWCSSYCMQTVESHIPKKRGKGEDVYVEEVRMCYWCYRFYRRTNRKPNVRELADHANGKRVKAGV